MALTDTGCQSLFGLPVNALRLDDVVDLCDAAISDGRRLRIGDVNAAIICAVRKDPELRRAVLGLDLVLPDGQSVVWASRYLDRPLPARVAGVDLFQALLGLADRRAHSVYFLGSTTENLARLQDAVTARWPNLVIAGARDGYFSDSEAPRIVEEVNGSRADLLFLGMPTPKKELFIVRHSDELQVAVTQGVGGSFDVVSGALRRAPEAWQALGLEWAYRLAQEPTRLWRRYLTTNSAFVALTLREHRHPTTLYRS